jgi:parallel beta-helix repeat protein
MPTLKRKNADGNWEYIQVSGLDVSQLKDDVDSNMIALADITPHLKSMGAVLDGIVDDAPIINNYINQIPVSGNVRTIILPDTTICVSTIIINTPNVVLIGGKNTVLKKKVTAPSGEDFIQVKADDVEIKNIKFDGNNTSNGYLVNANYNISPFVQRKNIKIEGLNYISSHVNGRGVIVGYYDGVEISRCVLENTVGTPNVYSFGIAVWSDQYAMSTMMTKNIHIHHNQIKGFYHGINSWGTGTGTGGNRQRMFIENNIVEKCYQSGIYSYHSPRSIVALNTVRNCGDIGIWSDSGNDYEYDYSDATQGYGNRVFGNMIYACRVGILTEEFRYGVISSNTIFQCVDYGIGIGGGTDSSSINHNTIFENGHGIYIDKNINPNTYYIFDLELTGNIVKRNKYHGVRVGGVRKTIKINGGFITDNGTVNIGVQTPSTIYAGIWLGKDGVNNDGTNVSSARITDVEITNGYQTGSGLTESGAQGYGVYTQQSAIERLTIRSTIFGGHTTNHIYAKYITLGLTIQTSSFLTTDISNDLGGSVLYTAGNVGQLTDYKNNNGNYILDGKWNTDHLVMNGNHLWVDSGKLYIKATAPTSATDGTVVGTQV